MFTTANFCPYDVKKLAFMHRCASLSSGGGLDGWSRWSDNAAVVLIRPEGSQPAALADQWWPIAASVVRALTDTWSSTAARLAYRYTPVQVIGRLHLPVRPPCCPTNLRKGSWFIHSFHALCHLLLPGQSNDHGEDCCRRGNVLKIILKKSPHLMCMTTCYNAKVKQVEYTKLPNNVTRFQILWFHRLFQCFPSAVIQKEHKVRDRVKMTWEWATHCKMEKKKTQWKTQQSPKYWSNNTPPVHREALAGTGTQLWSNVQAPCQTEFAGWLLFNSRAHRANGAPRRPEVNSGKAAWQREPRPEAKQHEVSKVQQTAWANLS